MNNCHSTYASPNFSDLLKHKSHRALFLILVGLILPNSSFAQLSPEKQAAFHKELKAAKNDTIRVAALAQLGSRYRFSDIDSSFFYIDRALELNAKIKSKYEPFSMREMPFLLSLKGATFLESGKLPESLEFQFEALRLAEANADKSMIALAQNRIGNTYMELADYKKANEYYRKSMLLFKSIGDKAFYYNEMSNIGNIYELRKMRDSALYFQKIVYDASQKDPNNRVDFTIPEVMFRMGNAHKLNGDNQKAMWFYKRGIVEANTDNDVRNLTMNNLFLAKLYSELNVADSTLKYARNAILSGKKVSFRKGLYDASLLLNEFYASRREYDSAHKYLSLAMIEKDSLMGVERFQKLQRIVLDEQERDREAATKLIENQNRQRQYVLLAGIGIFLIIASLLYRNNRQNKKANRILQHTLTDLKSTQSQLIQSEKMASLGELTAGIAHEIQNPLNFVKNFSEVSNELVDEILDERRKTTRGLCPNCMEHSGINDERDETLVDEILSDIKQNLEKIVHHGRRADGIVKGMLQHSRASSGEKERIDINSLTDEYLRLAFHGLRAKDKMFNAELVTHFDEKQPKANVLPQDIGRVLLNLFTNAFYATQQRKKSEGESFKPTLEVRTLLNDSVVEIHVSDNGNGIPKSIIDKIFQPFFTTKPTGEGTGLGLSMSYDIVTKGHGGSLKVESREGNGTVFIVSLPT
ncbi:MAG: tetratricopeptide repeat protein [Flavobacterium sp.]|uniref:tetratricopeptide repeat-containing sensor histidine kinase n=1 Tax=Flavobacterium sp. TaxID=239 RepID=UPI0011F6FCB8|nr:ATP-binding protein [Flavobacterium sp.]RZJ65457.1 MAG: tetratricopeptide repeat protein [Flavobacterium sp.]